MKLSIFTSYVMNRAFPAPEIGLKHMYDQGMRCADISEGLLATYPLHLHMEYLQEAGLIPNCLITTLDVVTASEQERKRNVAVAKGYIDQLEKQKIPFLMVAPKVIRARSRQEFDAMQVKMVEGFSELVDYAAGSGVMVTIENQSNVTRADSSMHDIRKILDAVPGLGYVLDAGNFFCIGEDVLTAYKLLSDRMVHAHFKDWKWDPYGMFAEEHMPRFDGTTLGEGLLPLRELAGLMQSDSYNGSVALEINSYNITPQILDDSSKFLRECFAL